MQPRSPKSFTWSDLLAALRACEGEAVTIRDGTSLLPSGLVGTKAAAKGTEFCLFSSEKAVTRTALVEQLESLSKSPGRRFMSAARARVNDANLLIEGVADQRIAESVAAVILTRRPKLGFNPSQQTGASTTFRNKRIKTG